MRQPLDYDVENIIATLEHRDRVRSILIIDLTSLCWERLVSMMQEPFPVLTVLRLIGKTAPALPDMFLGLFSIFLPYRISVTFHLRQW
jgi:hypothetical protein